MFHPPFFPSARFWRLETHDMIKRFTQVRKFGLSVNDRWSEIKRGVDYQKSGSEIGEIGVRDIFPALNAVSRRDYRSGRGDLNKLVLQLVDKACNLFPSNRHKPINLFLTPIFPSSHNRIGPVCKHDRHPLKWRNRHFSERRFEILKKGLSRKVKIPASNTNVRF